MNLKEISFEELLEKCRYSFSYEYDEVKAEVLRRFAELTHRIEVDVPKECEQCGMKQRAETAEAKLKDMQCCGNCICNLTVSDCERWLAVPNGSDGSFWCIKWQSDNMTQEERK